MWNQEEPGGLQNVVFWGSTGPPGCPALTGSSLPVVLPGSASAPPRCLHLLGQGAQVQRCLARSVPAGEGPVWKTWMI